MLFEHKLKVFSKGDNATAHDYVDFIEMMNFAKEHGTSPDIVGDSITLAFVPERYQPLVDEAAVEIDKVLDGKIEYFLLNGYHGLRYGKNEMNLTAILRGELK